MKNPKQMITAVMIMIGLVFSILYVVDSVDKQVWPVWAGLCAISFIFYFSEIYMNGKAATSWGLLVMFICMGLSCIFFKQKDIYVGSINAAVPGLLIAAGVFTSFISVWGFLKYRNYDFSRDFERSYKNTI